MADKKRENKLNCLNHIGSVVFEIMNALQFENEMDANLAIKCAMLHDIIEDTNLTYEEIKNQFGASVADGVLALTKNEAIKDSDEKMLDSLGRIKKQPKEIWMVKMANRISNLYAPPYFWNKKNQEKYKQEAILIHQELRDSSQYLANRLAKKIEDYL